MQLRIETIKYEENASPALDQEVDCGAFGGLRESEKNNMKKMRLLHLTKRFIVVLLGDCVREVCITLITLVKRV